MKHTKTLLCLLLALAMLLCAGCKNTDGVQSTSEPAPESSAPETSAPTEETVAPTEGEAAVSYTHLPVGAHSVRLPGNLREFAGNLEKPEDFTAGLTLCAPTVPLRNSGRLAGLA